MAVSVIIAVKVSLKCMTKDFKNVKRKKRKKKRKKKKEKIENGQKKIGPSPFILLKTIRNQ